MKQKLKLFSGLFLSLALVLGLLSMSVIYVYAAGTDTVDVRGIVGWFDDNNSNNERPEQVTVNLLQNGTLRASRTVTAGEYGLWDFEFENLPAQNDQGQIYTYTITVDDVGGYKAPIIETLGNYVFRCNIIHNTIYAYRVTVSPSIAAGGTVTGSGIYVAGSTVSVSATAKDGYKFTQWSENEVLNYAPRPDVNSATFVMPNHDETVSADFRTIILPVIQNEIFTGEEIKPTFASSGVQLDGVDGNYSDDYVLSYENNINVGTATVTVTFKDTVSREPNPNMGKKSTTFEITPATITAAMGTISEQYYTGAPIKPEPALTWNGKTLVKDTDYTLSYSDNVDVGQATVTATGKGNFTETVIATGTFSIKEKPAPTPPSPVTPSAVVKTLPVANTLTYDGQPQELVTAGEAKDGTMQYALGKSKSNIPTSGWSESIPTGTEAGDYFVWYKAKGDRSHTDSSSKCVTVTIGKVSSAVTTVPTVKSLLYSGEPQELLTAGEASGGEMLYAVGTSESNAPEDGWSSEIPTGTDPGTYYIWYKVVGDNDHEDIEPSYAGMVTIIENHSDNVLSIDLEKGIATVRDYVSGGTTEVPLYVITEGLTYRMYNPNSGEHFYTKDPEEAESLIQQGWRHESDSDFTVVSALEEDAVPVYRLYNPNCGGMHFYTTDAEEAKHLVSVGWNYEGISHYVYNASSTRGTPHHRLYNPNSPSGEHNWTSDEAEVDMLIEAGWIYEGVSWRIV